MMQFAHHTFKLFSVLVSSHFFLPCCVSSSAKILKLNFNGLAGATLPRTIVTVTMELSLGM